MLEEYTKLLIDFKSLPKYKRARTFMEISGYPHYENVCSNILKFYLDINNEHELKDLIINSVIHCAYKDFHLEYEFEKIEVLREVETNNGNRLDILIKTSKYIIGIENKIFHHLHNDLEDYYKTIKHFCHETKTPICIVLSLNTLTSSSDIDKIIRNNFINITYDQVFNNIKTNIGQYLNNTNSIYANHLMDFIKSIENLTPRTMENKSLWTFFKNNHDVINELNENFTQYRNSLYQKVYELKEVFPKEEYAPKAESQWIWNGVKEREGVMALVHDYLILGKRISVDTYIGLKCWEIKVFGRNKESTNFLFDTMCTDEDFLPNSLNTYERDNRLVFQRFDTDIDLPSVTQSLAIILQRIEAYKTKVDKTASNTTIQTH